MARWVKGPTTSLQPFPPRAYPACVMENGDVAYVARGRVQGQLVNGYTTRSGLKAYFPYGSVEHRVSDYEIMATDNPENLYWEKSGNGNVPRNAVQGSGDGNERYFIGRSCTPYSHARCGGSPKALPARHTPIAARLGKVHPSHGCMYVAHEGVEYNFTQYEVLCRK